MSSNKSFSSETTERYAKAIFELSSEKNELELVEKSLIELLNIYKSNSNLENFIKNPTHSFGNQLLIINKISALMNFTKTLKDFLSILVVKRRIFFLEKIIISFLKLVAIDKGHITAQLTSTKELSSAELGNLSNELSEAIGSNVSFDYKVDQSLIGGLKIQLGSLMVDTSIKNKLKKYEQIMLEN